MSESLKIVMTVAMQAVFEKLAPAFKAKTGRDIVMAFAPPSAAVDMVRNGEAADLVISSPDGIDALAKEGLVDGRTIRPVARMQMGLAVGLNEPKPDISTPEAFKQALLSAKSIIHADPSTGSPSAAHFIKVTTQLGIAGELAPKTTTRAGVVAHAVADGECAMAVQQLAELMLVPGVHVLGPFPEALQNYMKLSVAVHARSQAKEAAATLIDMATAPAAQAIVVQSGLLTP